MLNSGMNLVTTVIGIGMSSTMLVFICARLVCARIRSADSRPSAAAAAVFDLHLHSDLDTPELTIHGLEPVMVAAIPMMKYNREAFHCREDVQCTICLGEYQDKEMLRIMPICGHNFHVGCIDEWLQKRPTCPVCRLSLNDSSVAKYAASPILGVQSANLSEIDGRSNQWLLPSGHRNSRGGDDDDERTIRETALSVYTGSPHGEESEEPGR